MARCGCSGATCSCVIQGEGGVSVRGAGTVASPYVIDSSISLVVVDTPTVNLSLGGQGSANEPYILTANAEMDLGDLADVDDSSGSVGQVLALQADGQYRLVPPSTASPGAITIGQGLLGDGSSGSPLRVRLQSNSGLELGATGLRVASAGTWQSYTPQVSLSNGNNITLPSGSTCTGRYKRDGATVHVSVELDLSANFPAPVGFLRVALPVPDRAGGSARQSLQLTGILTDDGTDPGSSWQSTRIGFGSLEGTGRIERIHVDRGGYTYALGGSFPRWRAYRVRVWLNGSYEANSAT